MLEIYGLTASIALCSAILWCVVIILYALLIVFLLIRKGNNTNRYIEEFVGLVEEKKDATTLIGWIASTIGSGWTVVMMAVMGFAKTLRVIFLSSFTLYVIMSIVNYFGVL